MRLAVVLVAMLLGGCYSPAPVYRSHYYSPRQLDEIDWRLRMQELDNGFNEIDRLQRHQELLDKLDELR